MQPARVQEQCCIYNDCSWTCYAIVWGNPFYMYVYLVCTMEFPPLACQLTLDEPRHDKTNKVSVRPAKTQISLGIRPVWSEASLCAQSVAKDPNFLHADSEDSDQTGRMPRLIWVFASDQTGRMPRLIWVFAGRTLILLILSCRGSDLFYTMPWTWPGVQ